MRIAHVCDVTADKLPFPFRVGTCHKLNRQTDRPTGNL